MPPNPMSEPCARFFDGHWSTVDFSHFLVGLVSQLDRIEKHRRQVLAEAKAEIARIMLEDDIFEDFVEATAREAEEAKQHLKSPNPTTREYVFAQENVMLQMTLSRAVDNYVIFHHDLLRLVFNTRPEALRSSSRVESHEFIFQYQSMDDLRDAIIEKRLHQLDYDGFFEVTEQFRKLGVNPFSTSRAHDIRRLIAQRNLIVHNRGRLDQRYIDAFGEPYHPVGGNLVLEFGQVSDDIEVLALEAARLDASATEHFGLPTPILSDSHGCPMIKGTNCRYAQS